MGLLDQAGQCLDTILLNKNVNHGLTFLNEMEPFGDASLIAYLLIFTY